MGTNCTFLDRDTSVNGVIVTDEIVVEGTIKGEVDASVKVYVKEGGTIEGSVRTKKILFEDGARHKGMLILGDEVALQKNGQ